MCVCDIHTYTYVYTYYNGITYLIRVYICRIRHFLYTTINIRILHILKLICSCIYDIYISYYYYYYYYYYLLLLSELDNARVIIEAVLIIETITPK